MPARARLTLDLGVRALAATAALVCLAIAATVADRAAGGMTTTAIAADVGTGVALALAAAMSVGPAMERWLFVAAGAAWLMGSVSPGFYTLYLGFLLVTLGSFPTGRPSGVARWGVVLAAVAVAVQAVPQIGMATLFLACAVVARPRLRAWSASSWFASGAAVAISGALFFSFWALSIGAVVPLRVLQFVVVGVAASFTVTTRRTASMRHPLADAVVRDNSSAQVEGLQRVLRHSLGDASLEVEPWRPGENAGASERGRRAATPGQFLVEEDGVVLAVVRTRSPALSDPSTVDAVTQAVRLTFAHGRLLEETARRRAELEASRGRLLETTDRERENVAARLREETLAPLRRAAQSLTPLIDALGASTELSSALTMALNEVSSTEVEIGRIVSGVPPVALGEGRIGDAVRGLARLAGSHLNVTIDPLVCGTTDAETALFYVCSESLSNAAKHATGSVVTVSLMRLGDRLVLAVHDDGPGGADTSRPGLVGLRDRLAAAGGTLKVDSPPGIGTSVVADVPAGAAG